jgi:hypothetical protein
MKIPLLRTTLLLLLLLLLTGCLSMETRITMSDGERGELTYVYTVNRELLEAEVFDREAEHWPIPIARRDFELFGDAIPGAQLTGYSREDGDSDSVVTAVYSFRSLEALRQLLSMREPVAMEPGEGDFALRFQLTPMGVAQLAAGQREFLQSYLSESTVTFTVTTPEPIAASSPEAPEGRTVTVERSLEELLDRREPLFLEVAW